MGPSSPRVKAQTMEDEPDECAIDKIISKKGSLWHVQYVYTRSENGEPQRYETDWIDNGTLEDTEGGLEAKGKWQKSQSQAKAKTEPKNPSMVKPQEPATPMTFVHRGSQFWAQEASQQAEEQERRLRADEERATLDRMLAAKAEEDAQVQELHKSLGRARVDAESKILLDKIDLHTRTLEEVLQAPEFSPILGDQIKPPFMERLKTFRDLGSFLIDLVMAFKHSPKTMKKILFGLIPEIPDSNSKPLVQSVCKLNAALHYLRLKIPFNPQKITVPRALAQWDPRIKTPDPIIKKPNMVPDNDLNDPNKPKVTLNIDTAGLIFEYLETSFLRNLCLVNTSWNRFLKKILSRRPRTCTYCHELYSPFDKNQECRYHPEIYDDFSVYS